jgi:hypothetical protein
MPGSHGLNSLSCRVENGTEEGKRGQDSAPVKIFDEFFLEGFKRRRRKVPFHPVFPIK